MTDSSLLHLFSLLLLFTAILPHCIHSKDTSASPIITISLTETPSNEKYATISQMPRLILTSPHSVAGVQHQNAAASPESISFAPGSFTLRQSASYSFNLTGLAPGPYFIEIVSQSHMYPLLRLDIAKRTHKVRLMRNDESKRLIKPLRTSQPAVVPKDLPQDSDALLPPQRVLYKIHPDVQTQFFVDKQPLQILNYLKNPMVLIVGFGLLVMIFMPMLAQSESMKEVQGMIGEGEDLLGGWMDSMKEKAKQA